MTDNTSKDKFDFEFDASTFDPGFSLDTDTTSIPNKTYISSLIPFMWEQELMNQPPVDYLVDGWLPEEATIVIFGEPKAFKSFVIIDIVLHMTHGMAWCGLDTAKGAVAYICAEGSGGFGKRLRAWKQHHNVTHATSPLVTIARSVNLTDDKEVDQLIQTLKHIEAEHGIKFKMVVFDTLARCMAGADENSNGTMMLAIAGSDKVRQQMKCASVIVHHSPKDKSRTLRGASALKGALDTLIFVEKTNMTATVTLDNQKDDEDGLEYVFTAKEVFLPERRPGKKESSLVMTRQTTTEFYPFAVPNTGLRVDTVHRDLVDIATVLDYGCSYPLTTAASLVFRNKNDGKRITEAVPEYWTNVKTEAGIVKCVRRVKPKGAKGFVVQVMHKPNEPGPVLDLPLSEDE